MLEGALGNKERLFYLKLVLFYGDIHIAICSLANQLKKGHIVKKLFCFILLFCSFAPMSYAQDSYISDKLFTYMRSGPSDQYRIIGSVNAGDKVQQISQNGKYTQIVDPKGRKGWVESNLVSNKMSNAARLPALEAELARVKGLLANAEDKASAQQAGLATSLKQRNQQIQDLEANYKKTNEQLIASQTEIRELRAKIDTQKDDLLMRWFMYGGGVAVGGLFLGLILPHMIPRRRKKNNGWA